MSVTTIIPIPPSINEMYRSRARVYKTEKAAGYEQVVAEKIDEIVQQIPPPPWDITFWFYFPTKRRRDVDGPIKAGLDAVTRALNVDDSNVMDLHAFKRLSRKHPRCEVVIATSTATMDDDHE